MCIPQQRTLYLRFEPKKPIRLALVLGGGGARGLAHLGAIRELEAAGIRPDLIIGCSAGAIIGAFYADDPELTRIENLLLSLRKADLLDTNIFRSRFGVVRGKMLRKFMKRHLHAKTFSELKIPLIVIATDLFTGEVVELSQRKFRSPCARPALSRGSFSLSCSITVIWSMEGPQRPFLQTLRENMGLKLSLRSTSARNCLKSNPPTYSALLEEDLRSVIKNL